jgi:hypothetical protein
MLYTIRRKDSITEKKKRRTLKIRIEKNELRTRNFYFLLIDNNTK